MRSVCAADHTWFEGIKKHTATQKVEKNETQFRRDIKNEERLIGLID